MKTINKLSILFILVLITSLILACPVLAQGPTPGDINGDQAVIGSTNFRLSSGQNLNGNLVVIGGTATLEEGSIVNGDISILGGIINISGEVRGDITGFGGTITLTDTARIVGNIMAPGVVLNKSENAVIEGTITLTPSEDSAIQITPPVQQVIPKTWFTNGFHSIGRLLWGILQVLGTAVLALIIALLLPIPLKRVATVVSTQPAISGGIGLLTIILTPVIVIMLTITIILIPFTILFLVALGIALFFGWIAVGLELGNRLAKAFKTTWTVPLATGLGTLLLTLVAAIFAGVSSLASCFAAIFIFIISIIGLGSIILTRFGIQDYPETATPGSSSIPPTRPETPVIEAITGQSPTKSMEKPEPPGKPIETTQPDIAESNEKQYGP